MILVGIRKDIDIEYEYPKPYNKVYNLRDALKKGDLYNCDVPESEGVQYPKRKKEILAMVPQYGYWRDLPLEIQKEYMQKVFYLGGGKTGMARRIGWDEPSLTLTCSPTSEANRTMSSRRNSSFYCQEYARIQTFPDEWQFLGKWLSNISK